MRRFVVIITSVALAVSGLALTPAQAVVVDVNCSGGGDFTIENNIVTGNGDCVGAAVIPSGVTSIGASAFAGNQGLTSVTIPASVLSIGDFAFAGTKFLQTVTLNEGLLTIGASAFDNSGNTFGGFQVNQTNSALTSMAIPNTVTSIGTDAFTGNAALATVSIGSGLQSLGFDSFFGTSSLSSITVDSGNTAFSAVGNVLFNKSQTVLRLYPAGLTSSTYSVPNTVTEIADYAITFSASLTNINLSTNLLRIGGYAIAGNTLLTSIDVPDSVTTIGFAAFGANDALEQIFLGEALSTLETQGGVIDFPAISFQTPKLTSISVHPDNLFFSSLDGVFYNKSRSALLKYPSNLPNSSFSVPGTVELIAPAAFDFNQNLTNIELNDGLLEIGVAAFSPSLKLESLRIPDSVTDIGDAAFSDVLSLTSVTLGSRVESIGAAAFSNTSITSIVIPQRVSDISYGAFEDCNFLTSVTFLGNAPNVDPDVFLNVALGARGFINPLASGFGEIGSTWNNLIITLPAATPPPSNFSGSGSSTTIKVELKITNTLKKKGHVFVGWSEKKDGTGKTYLESDLNRLSKDTVLYSQWKLAPAKKTVSGFAPNSSKLNLELRNSAKKFVSEVPKSAKITCHGSAPGMAGSEIGKALALARASKVCGVIKKSRPDIKTTVALNSNPPAGLGIHSVVLDYKW